MKHLYTFAIALLTLLTSFTASADDITYTIEIADASTITATVSGTSLTLQNGANTFTCADYSDLVIAPTEGYVLISVTRNGSSEYFSGNYSANINSYYGTEQAFKVTTQDIDSYYSGSFTLKVDNPEKVAARFSGTYRSIENIEETQVVKYNPEKEVGLTLSCKNYSEKLYKVLVNGEEKPINYGQAEISLSQDAVVEVYADYPDIDVPFSISFTNENTSDFISALTVNNETKTAEEYLAEGFSVKVGSTVKITYNTSDFKFNHVYVNGKEEYYSYSYEAFVTDATTVEFDVTRYENHTKVINLTGAEYVTIYKGYSYNNTILELQEGANNYEFNDQMNIITIEPQTGYVLKVLKDGENDLLPNWSSYNNSITLSAEGELTIEVGERVLDKQFVLYIDDKSAAATYFNVMNSERATLDVETGYNVIKFDNAYLPIATSWYGPQYNNLYLNNEKQEGLYGGNTNYELRPEDGDVAKIYFTCDPELFDVTIVNDDNVEVTITRDVIVPVSDYTSPISVLPGTQFKIAGEEAFKVKVGEAEAEETTEYTFTATEASTITIMSNETSGIDNVAVTETENTVVYNLQGIPVATKATIAELPAGIYIVNGKKVAK